MTDPDPIPDPNNEFEEQLRLEEISKELEGDHVKTKTDKDGTVYEWVAAKKAWFPKLDAEFLVKYQMNYGVNTNESASSTPATVPAQNVENSQETDYSHFYQWYAYYYPLSSSNPSENATSNSKPIPDSKDMEEAYQKYLDFYYKDKTSAEPSIDFDKDPVHAHYHKYYTETYLPSVEQVDELMRLDYNAWYRAYVNPGTALIAENAETVQNIAVGFEKIGTKKNKEKKEKKVLEQVKEDPGWFEIEDTHNKTVYIMGLPEDITFSELEEFVKKVGLIQYDPLTNKPKLKLYKDSEGKVKGDGLCTYIKSESVNLALQILDESLIRGYKIKVETAKFELKGDYDPMKKKRKLTNKEKKRIKLKEERLLAWVPDKLKGERQNHEKTIILKNAFDPKDFEKSPELIQELKEDFRLECSKFENLKNVLLHDRHKDGVVEIRFKEYNSADKCLESLHGRWFGGKQLTAEQWDGKTKYVIHETEEQRKARDANWQKFLFREEENRNTTSYVETDKTPDDEKIIPELG